MDLSGEATVDNHGKGPSGTPAGYARLIQRHGLRVIPNWHESHVASTAVRRKAAAPDGSVFETYGAAYWPGDSDFEHLEFALKYDGTNLALLAELFQVLDADGLTQFIAAALFGKYRRRLWYLFEWLTRRRLSLADMASGNYVDLVPAEECFTSARRRLVARQRVNDNLLGDRGFSPCSTPSLTSDFGKPTTARGRTTWASQCRSGRSACTTSAPSPSRWQH